MAKQSIIGAEDVFPGKIVHDDLVLDVDRPLEDQVDGLTEDLLVVMFPNGCTIAIGWYPEFLETGSFRIELNEDPDAWAPLRERRCRSIAQLRAIVKEFTQFAMQQTRRHLFSKEGLGAEYPWRNDLVLDPGLPLDRQLDALKEELLEVAFLGHVLLVGWSPAHSAAGEFVIQLKHNPEQWQFPSQDFLRIERVRHPEAWLPFLERRCRSVTELQDIVKGFAGIAKDAPSKYLLTDDQFDLGSVYINGLVARSDVPLKDQLYALSEQMLEVAYVPGYVLTAGWRPAHDPNGEFLITLHQTETEWKHEMMEGMGFVWRRDRDPASWRPLRAKRCRSVCELKAIVEEFAGVAKQGLPSDIANEP